MNAAMENFDLAFPSLVESALVLHPGKVPADFLSAGSVVGANNPEFSRVVGSVGRDQFDSDFHCQNLIRRVRVVGLVVNPSFGQLVAKASGEFRFYNLTFNR